MADLWLERELARQLAPAAAPESLWDRIHRQHARQRRRPARRMSRERTFWPLVLAMVLLAFGDLLRTLSVNGEPDRLPNRNWRSWRDSRVTSIFTRTASRTPGRG